MSGVLKSAIPSLHDNAIQFCEVDLASDYP